MNLFNQFDDSYDKNVVMKFLRRDFVWKKYDTLGSGLLDELVKITNTCARFFSSHQDETLSEMKKIFQAVLDVIRCWRNLCQVEFSISKKKKGPEITKFKNKDEDERENKNYVKTNSSFVTCFLFFSMIKQEGRKMIPATDLGTLRKIRLESRKTFRFLFQLLGGDEIYGMIERFIEHIVKLPNKNFQKLSISALNTLLSLKKSFNHPQICPLLRRLYPTIFPFFKNPSEEFHTILRRSFGSFWRSLPDVIFSESSFTFLIPSLLPGLHNEHKNKTPTTLLNILSKLSKYESSEKWLEPYFKELSVGIMNIDIDGMMMESMRKCEEESIDGRKSAFEEVLRRIRIRIKSLELLLQTATKNQIPFLRDELFPILMERTISHFVGFSNVQSAFPYVGIDWSLLEASIENVKTVNYFCLCLMACFRKVFYFRPYFQGWKMSVADWIVSTKEELEERRLQIKKYFCDEEKGSTRSTPNSKPKIRTYCFVLKLLLERMGLGGIIHDHMFSLGLTGVFWIVSELCHILPVEDVKKYIVESDSDFMVSGKGEDWVRKLFSRNRSQKLGKFGMMDNDYRSRSMFRPYLLNAINLKGADPVLCSHGLGILTRLFSSLKYDMIFYIFEDNSVRYGRLHHSIGDETKTCSVDLIMKALFQRFEFHRKKTFPFTVRCLRYVIHNLHNLVFYILKKKEDQEEEEEEEKEEKEKVNFFLKKYGVEIFKMLRSGVKSLQPELPVSKKGIESEDNWRKLQVNIRNDLISIYRLVLRYFVDIQEYSDQNSIFPEMLEDLTKFSAKVNAGSFGALTEPLKKEYEELNQWCIKSKAIVERI